MNLNEGATMAGKKTTKKKQGANGKAAALTRRVNRMDTQIRRLTKSVRALAKWIRQHGQGDPPPPPPPPDYN